MVKGILKNARPDASYRKESPNDLDMESMTLDRQKVIENTKLNADAGKPAAGHVQASTGNGNGNGNDSKTDKPEDPLQWDERNLLINEQEKCATMKIDEPKTPYLGGFNPNNDYYRTDNEHDDEFNLGEGVDDDALQDEAIDAEPEEEGEGAETGAGAGAGDKTHELSKHELFELKRKQHYFMKAAPLKEHRPEQDE